MATLSYLPVASVTNGNYVVGFVDADGRGRIYDNSVAYPQAAGAPVAVTYTDGAFPATQTSPDTAKPGGYFINLTFAAGSKEVASPQRVFVSNKALVLTSSTATGS